MKVAAIIPVYNRPTLVLEALESVAAQTQPPRKLIVVDDGSTDNTADNVAAWLAARDLPFEAQLVRAPHTNVSTARNRAADEAGDCEVLAFLDSDDLWPPDYIERMARVFAERPDVVAATADKLEFNYGNGAVPELRDYRCIAGQATNHLMRKGPPGPSVTAVRAATMAAVGGWDPETLWAEDFELMLRISLKGAWAHVPGAPVTYRLEIGRTRGEDSALTYQYDRRGERWAAILERFIERTVGGVMTAPRRWRHALARAWFNAGRHHYRNGSRADTGPCIRRALALRPFSPRLHWWRLFRS